VAEDDRNAAPAAVGECPVVSLGAVMGIDDEAFHADAEEVVHRVGDEGTAADGQQGLGAIVGQRPHPHAQSRSEEKRRPKVLPFLHRFFSSFLPNAGSIFTMATTRKLGSVVSITQRKNHRYPINSCSQPLNIAGIIIPRAMMPVEIA